MSINIQICGIGWQNELAKTSLFAHTFTIHQKDQATPAETDSFIKHYHHQILCYTVVSLTYLDP